MVKQKPDQHYQLKSLNHRFVDNTFSIKKHDQSCKRNCCT